MNDFWVFGYGSLMWNPGFAFEERKVGRVFGLKRALCVLSHVHRGTPERPGLVLGLDAGGSCRGIGYRIAPEQREDALRYLRQREQVTLVYREITTRFVGDDGHGATAVTYAVDRRHPQYAGRLDMADLLRLARQGFGKSGSCRDYIASTLSHLRELGIHDPQLEGLARLLDQAKDSAG